MAIGKNPRNFADRNLVAALRNRIGGDGVIGGSPNSTYWGVLALRAAGVPAPGSSLAVIRGAPALERRVLVVGSGRPRL